MWRLKMWCLLPVSPAAHCHEEPRRGTARQEAEAFAKAASLDTHKALVHIFFAQRATKKARLRTCAASAC
jgi:hypothetical protein